MIPSDEDSDNTRNTNVVSRDEPSDASATQAPAVVTQQEENSSRNTIVTAGDQQQGSTSTSNSTQRFTTDSTTNSARTTVFHLNESHRTQQRRKRSYPGQSYFKWKDDSIKQQPVSAKKWKQLSPNDYIRKANTTEYQSTSNTSNSSTSMGNDFNQNATSSGMIYGGRGTLSTTAGMEESMDRTSTTTNNSGSAPQLMQQSIEQTGGSGSVEIDFILDRRGANVFVNESSDFYAPLLRQNYQKRSNVTCQRDTVELSISPTLPSLQTWQEPQPTRTFSQQSNSEVYARSELRSSRMPNDLKEGASMNEGITTSTNPMRTVVRREEPEPTQENEQEKKRRRLERIAIKNLLNYDNNSD